MKLFAKIKKFFKRLVDAVRELFGAEPEGPIDIEVVTETTTDAEGNQTIVKTEKINTTPSWKEIFGKAKRKVMDGIDKFVENPAWFTVKVGVISAAITGAIGTVKLVVSPITKAREAFKKKRQLYNDRTHLNYQLKRPLTKEEINAVNAAQERKENITQLLDSYGVLY